MKINDNYVAYSELITVRADEVFVKTDGLAGEIWRAWSDPVIRSHKMILENMISCKTAE